MRRATNALERPVDAATERTERPSTTTAVTAYLARSMGTSEKESVPETLRHAVPETMRPQTTPGTKGHGEHRRRAEHVRNSHERYLMFNCKRVLLSQSQVHFSSSGQFERGVRRERR